ncbi:right-handed parallel beta-helix repeat-containing protein [Verrucomicrobia bacterium S94]|nr:right-handed parallel beta-helix repeat-containing protein [Verrucomicrobia bacterium S94]
MMMGKMVQAGLFLFGVVLGGNAQVAVIDEGFESLSPSETVGINQPIADTGLRLHNHITGEVVTPDPAFISASGLVLQLTTGTNPTGGWGILSADNRPRAVSLIEGEEIILEFDLFVQAVPEGSGNIELSLSFDVGDSVEIPFDAFTGASAGDVLHVSWTNTVTAGMTAASTISPSIGFEGSPQNFSTTGPNGDGTEVNVAQIDHIKLFARPAPTAIYYLDADGGNDSNSGTSPAEAWKTLDKASSVTLAAGEQLLLERGDTFTGKLILDDEAGTAQQPVIIGAYGSGDRPVIDAAQYEAGIRISDVSHVLIRDLEITADSGIGQSPLDGSNMQYRYGVYIKPTSGNAASDVTLTNLYIHHIFPPQESENEGHNPTTYMGSAIEVIGQSGNRSKDIVITDCEISDTGHKFLGLKYCDNVQVLNNYMERIGGPAMVPNNIDDLVVRGNTVNGSGQYTDPRMHGRGSGIWPINCNRVLIENNRFMHARGRYDSCGAHIDIGNKDVIIQYNLSMDNEGGFVEILGVNSNCTYRYNISINDGARRAGVNENGLAQGSGHTILFSGHNFGEQERHGPYNSYIYNNTIYVKEEQLASFSVEQGTLGALVANNIFYIEGELEDESPYWRGDFPANVIEGMVWTNNLYQRGGIFPDWVFEEDDPIYGNPKLANPGGLTESDYIPAPGSIVEGRGIDIPQLPEDPDGIMGGLTVTQDFFGNPIVGQPDIGAVEIGGGISTETGSAFEPWPEEKDGSVEMTAVPGPAGAEYYFAETSGNVGGDDSGWQSFPHYTDTGLLPNTLYSYTVTTRNAAGVEIGTSVEEAVLPVSSPPFPDHIILKDDFSLAVNPENHTAPFPENTWYLVDGNDYRENQSQSVSTYSGWLQLGFGYEEMRLLYCSDRNWSLNHDYEFSGDWKIDTLFENHLGFSVGFGEFDPETRELLHSITNLHVGNLDTPTTNDAGSFTLYLSAEDLQAESVSPSNRVGVYFYRDDDGIEGVQGSPKSDIYLVDNLSVRLYGDDLDEDADGIPDHIEEAVGQDLESDGDYDGDGLLNAEEVLVGTPVDSSNALFTAGISNMTQIVVTEPWVLSNRIYILEQKESLISSNGWKTVDSVSGTEDAGNGDIVFPAAGITNQSFYRVRIEWE